MVFFFVIIEYESAALGHNLCNLGNGLEKDVDGDVVRNSEDGKDGWRVRIETGADEFVNNAVFIEVDFHEMSLGMTLGGNFFETFDFKSLCFVKVEFKDFDIPAFISEGKRI